MGGKVLLGAVGGLALLPLAFITLAGGAGVASAQAPSGGCAVRVSGPVTGSATVAAKQKGATLTAPRMAVARTIVGVAKGMGVTERGAAIALGTAMQESTLDPEATDGYGTGVFQQQGELYANVTKKDPAAAAGAFYRQLLARVPNYANADPAHGGITFADAAQQVQRSGAGASYYAQWEQWASALAQQLYDGTPGQGGGARVSCAVGGGSGPIRVLAHGLTVQLPAQAGVTGEVTFPTQRAATAAIAALSYLGTPYAWGGGGPNGPGRGIRDGGAADAHGDDTKTGFDCSGLTQYAYTQAGISLPRTAAEQQRIGGARRWEDARPGDLVFWGSPAHHVAVYLGRVGGTAYMVEAPQSGDVVRVSKVRTGERDFTSTVVEPYTAVAAPE
ncbi:MAG: C40 family peptidase [Pseudonocardiaceae bacterium]